MNNLIIKKEETVSIISNQVEIAKNIFLEQKNLAKELWKKSSFERDPLKAMKLSKQYKAAVHKTRSSFKAFKKYRKALSLVERV